MKVYVHECYSCGKIRQKIAKLKQEGKLIEIIDTRLTKGRAEKHLELLKHAGMSTNFYHAIVVDGGVIRMLRDV